MRTHHLPAIAVFWAWAIAVAGCTQVATTPAPNPTKPTPTEVPTPTPTASPSQSPTPTEAPTPTASPSQSPTPTEVPTPTPTPSTPAPSPSNPTVEPSPTPTTSPRTPDRAPLKIGSVSEIEGDVSCRQTGGIFAYAETAKYLVYICSDPNDPTQPRYYRSFNRNGTPGITLEATDYDPWQMRYFEFKNGGYTYLLQIPTGATPNPLLTVQLPDGSYVEEPITRYLAK